MITTIETFPALAEIPGLEHGFTLRIPGVDVAADRETVVARLDPHWGEIVPGQLWSAEQIHGSQIAEISGATPALIPGVDGLIAQSPGSHLGILVADCAAVYVLDPVRKACGLFHSGKKGTELGIVPQGINMLISAGSRPADLIVQVAPCIRPPLYEINFPKKIREDALAVGIPENQFFDCGTCTGQQVDRYYSYRIEKGKTGRMLAFVGFEA